MSENPYASAEVPNSLELPPRRWGSLFLKVFLLTLVVVILAAFLLPMTRRGSEAPRRTQCKNNLRQIGLALHDYHDNFGSFPPAYTVDTNGRMLHSWRSLLLPYLEQQSLYQQIDFSKPWYDPANAAVFETSLAVFQCPSASIPKNHTIYLGVTGEDCCFNADTPKRIADFTDGTSNTLIVVEVPVDRSVAWMAPQDADEALILGIAQDSKVAHKGGFQVLLGDGAARFISANVDRSTLRALITTSGKDVVGEF